MATMRRTDGFIQLGILLVITLFAMASMALVNGSTTNLKQNSLVLSNSDEDNDDGDSDSSGSDDDFDESESEDSNDSESESDEIENETPEPKSTDFSRVQKVKTESKDNQNSVRSNIKTEAENKKRRAVLLQNTKKIKFETRNGTSTIKIENEDGTETEEELEDNEEFKLDGDLADLSLENDNDDSIIKQDNLRVKTNFPISINLETNELVITTPSGVKTMTVLPKQAIENLLRSKKITFVLPSSSPLPSTTPQESPVATSENELNDTIESEIEIEEKDGEVLYVVQGAKEKKLFGVFNISVPRTYEVSAETGEVLNTNQSIVSIILDVLSF